MVEELAGAVGRGVFLEFADQGRKHLLDALVEDQVPVGLEDEYLIAGVRAFRKSLAR
jgi:hypothetical protein